MKRIIVAALLLAVSSPVVAQEKTKHELVLDLMKLFDTKSMTRKLVHSLFNAPNDEQQQQQWMAQLSDDERAQYEKQRERERARQQILEGKILQRIDYDRFTTELYAPLYEQTFTAAEIEQLIAFYKTPAGRKESGLIADLAFNASFRAIRLLNNEMEEAQQEIAREEEARAPHWKRAMADIRSLATASEAYATDVNHYPEANDVTEVAKIIEPTYIRKAPLKDPWGNEYAYVVSSDHMHYRFVSAGSDGVFDWDSRRIEDLPPDFAGTPTDASSADIIFQDGQFVRFPRDSQNDE